MIENTKQRRRAGRLFLLVHIICYELFFLYTFIGTATLELRGNIFILLLWTPLLLVHTAVTYYLRGRSGISRLEREAYRDGYADAMRQTGERPEPIGRLALDEDGELVDIPVKYKRQS